MSVEMARSPGLQRVHMGCGLTYLEGWINCDGGPSTRLFSALPKPVRSLLQRSAGLGQDRKTFWQFLEAHEVIYVNACKNWPFPNNSIDIIYSSHMIDCLTTAQIRQFFIEAYRVLKPGGQIRLAGIDIDKEIHKYLEQRDLQSFVTMMSYPDPKKEKLLTRLKQAILPPTIYLAHLDFNMYQSLLREAGFAGIVRLPPGQTQIQHYEPIHLWQRHGESIYVEACKPGPVPPSEPLSQ